MFNCVIIRYSEIGLKGKYIRKRFEKLLLNNIKKAIRDYEHEGVIKSPRLIIYCKECGKISRLCSNVFGVSSASPCIEISQNWDLIKETALKIYNINKGVFRITCRRITKEFEKKSREVCVELGDYIREKTGAGVNMEEYDTNIYLEFFKNKAYVFNKKEKGFGGLPVGSQDKVIVLFTGRTNSALSSLLMMKRGCHPVFLHFDTGNKKRAENVFNKIKNKYAKNLGLRLIIKKLKENSVKNFMKTAKKIMNEEDCLALVSGETLKTKNNFKLEKSIIKKPVFYPIIGLDSEIMIKKLMQ